MGNSRFQEGIMYNRKFKARPKGKNGPRQSFRITLEAWTVVENAANRADNELRSITGSLPNLSGWDHDDKVVNGYTQPYHG